ncbi:MAG TPA: fumarylacetoacetate hydrolase family protein [Solirubrobacteraceae bacterium]|nr:fumarylacetoacetate hydrolase family protein [Solirubrobacteraceae bacterium]
MEIGRIEHHGPDGPVPRVVVARNGGPWVDVRAAERLRLERGGASPAAARRLADVVAPGSLTAALENGEAFLEAAHNALQSGQDQALAPTDARLLAPLDPPAYRDFMAFEKHFRTPYERNGTAVPDVLYELPVSYMGSAQAMLGPDDDIPWPAYSEKIDFELELGIVIGRTGRNVTPGTAREHILGVTVFNDFSARDIQMHEMSGRLGPSKGKHFASAVGPRIVTLDALDPAALTMIARVNGEEWTRASSGSILWSIEELVSWASTGEQLVAGTLLGTGTVGGGCGMELQRMLQVGDTIELEIEGIGVLRNRITTDPDSGWRPTPRLSAGATAS